MSYIETANYFEISNLSIIVNWQHKFDENGILSLNNKQRGRSSKIKKKNRKVKQDNHLPLKEENVKT